MKRLFSMPLQVLWQKYWFVLAITGLVVMSGYLVFGNSTGLVSVLNLKTERDELKLEISRLQAEKDALELQIVRLNEEDSSVIEEEARKKGMVREGETVYKLRYVEGKDSLKVKQRKEESGGR